MALTPNRQLRVYVGGSRTVMLEQATWGEFAFEDIAYQGREDETNTSLIDGVGWRIMEERLDGAAYYERGIDEAHVYDPVNGNATFAVYADTLEPVQSRPSQRHLSELGVPLGDQTTQGVLRVQKDARALLPLSGAIDDLPGLKTPVPLHSVLLSTDQLDADDSFAVSFGCRGPGNKTIGEYFRFYFPGLAGTTPQDVADQLKGTGRYAMRFYGDSTAYLYELATSTNPETPLATAWRLRASYTYCNDNEALGKTHFFRVTSDAQRDGDGNLFGRVMSFTFGTMGMFQPRSGLIGTLVSVSVFAIDASNISRQRQTYRVPGATIANQPISTAVQCDARWDTSINFQAVRTVFRESGTLTTKRFALNQAPNGGKIHIQVFGSFPAGTSGVIRLFGATTGAECALDATVVSNRVAHFADFVPIQGERTYVVKIEMNASLDRLKSPTIKRIRYIRESQHASIVETETEITNVARFSTTGGGSDPATRTMGFVCYDLTGAQNEKLKLRAGMKVRAELDLGPDPDNPEETLKTVVFRGQLSEVRRRRIAGPGKQGFNGSAPLRTGPLCRYTAQCVGEWHRLCKHLAPGRLDLAYDGNIIGVGAVQSQPHKVTDIVRYLMLAMLPAKRVDVPDLPIRLPLDLDAPTFIEKYQPIMPVVVQLIRDYLGGYLIADDNASPPEGDPRGTTDEGMWRVMVGKKRDECKPVAEFCESPVSVVPGISVVDPMAYPDGSETTGEGEEETTRPIPRTFLRQGSTDEWIEPPSANQIICVGVGVSSSLTINTQGLIKKVYNNWPTATFPQERNAPAQGTTGGPPAIDSTHPDYCTGDVVTLYHSDPMLNTERAVEFVGRRLYDMKAHAKKWVSGESPLLLVKKTTTGDDLQINPRPLLFGDTVILGDKKYVMAEEPSILIDGAQGGSRFSAAFNAMYEIPFEDTYLHAYGEMHV